VRARFGEPSDAWLPQKLTRLGLAFRHNKQLANCFIVQHFAGLVPYNVTSFLNKNRDDLVPSLQAVCEKSDSETMRAIFGDAAVGPEGGRETTAAGGKSGSSSKRSVATQFRAQLASLLATLNTTEPHFVRCVKSNSLNRPDTFDAPMVLRQLRYSGLMEVSRIRQQGYPVRRGFEEFFERYRCLSGKAVDLDSLTASLSGKDGLLREWQKGKTQVFMRDQTSRELEAARETRLSQLVLKIQKHARMVIQKSRYRGFQTLLNKLRDALVSNDLSALERALLGTGNLPHQGVHLAVVKDARKQLDVLQEQARILALLAEAVASRDPTAIESAMQAAAECGLSKHPQVIKASNIIKTIREERAARDALRAAVLSRKEDELDAALALAQKLGAWWWWRWEFGGAAVLMRPPACRHAAHARGGPGGRRRRAPAGDAPRDARRQPAHVIPQNESGGRVGAPHVLLRGHAHPDGRALLAS
jgi:myosin heavy subunit